MKKKINQGNTGVCRLYHKDACPGVNNNFCFYFCSPRGVFPAYLSQGSKFVYGGVINKKIGSAVIWLCSLEKISQSFKQLSWLQPPGFCQSIPLTLQFLTGLPARWWWLWDQPHLHQQCTWYKGSSQGQGARNCHPKRPLSDQRKPKWVAQITQGLSWTRFHFWMAKDRPPLLSSLFLWHNVQK